MAAVALWLVSFAFTFCTIVLHNDHFGRISPGRQIARYGELPFRDFFDPGYFLTEFSSAAVQLLLGDNVLGEVLLDASFIATGTVLVLLLARRVTGSLAAGAAAALLALLAMPRAYDYDKVLFYALGVFLCWWYIERKRPSDAALLGVGLVVAALFRYDSGVYIGAAALAGMAVVHGRDWRGLARGLAAFTAAMLLAAAPVVLFIHRTAGVGDAVDQVLTYGVRESEPFRIFIVDPPPPPQRINVRWAPTVDEATRAALEKDFGLGDPALNGSPEDRTWSYVAENPSTDRLRSLVRDPHVEDTHLIDRERFRPTPEPLATRLERALPVVRMRMRPDMYNTREEAFLYFGLMALPVAAAFVLARRSDAPADRVPPAALWSLIVMCVMLDLFILRAPVGARIGGMAGPPAVLAAWLVARVWQGTGPRAAAGRVRVLARTATTAFLLATVWSVSVMAEWPRHVTAEALGVSRVRGNLATFRASPPSASALSFGQVEGIVDYLRECTMPDDRVFVSWFAPELPFLAQRPSGGATWSIFGEHWSERRFQQRMVDALRSEGGPIVILDMTTYAQFAGKYPLLDGFLRHGYRFGGESDFGDPSAPRDGYRVLIRRDRVPTGTHAGTSMPCFA